MRNDMGALLFRRSSVKNSMVRRRFNLVCDVEPASSEPKPTVVQMDFRLGEEPDNCRILRILSARTIDAYRGWVTALVAVSEPVAERDDRADAQIDSFPTQEPMRTKRSRYEASELELNFGVLKRFLGSRVGRNWGLVLGEIRRSCDVRNFRGHTLNECLDHIVVTNVDLVDGVLCNVESNCPLTDSPDRFRYFVHPVTGLLQHLPRQPKRSKKQSA